MVFVILTLFLALNISCISCIILKNIIGKYKKYDCNKKEILGLIISYITIFNFMYLENMYFVESIVMAISVLALIKSADILIEKQNKYYIKSVILVISAVFAYQGTICFYILIGIVLSIIKNKKDIKTTVKDILKIASIVLIAIGTNLLVTKTIGNILGTSQGRIGSIKNIINNISVIIKNLNYIITECCGLFPKYLYILFTAVITIFASIRLIEKREKSKIIELLFIIIVAILASFITYLMSTTSFNTGRLRISLGATIGVIYMYLYCRTDIFEEKKLETKLLIILLAIYTIFNTYNYMSIMYEHKQVNKLEKQEALEIGQYIEKQGNINQIYAIIVKNNSNKAHYNTKNKSVITYSALKSDWAVTGAINFYNNIKLQRITSLTDEIREKANKYLQNTNEEYFCIDNILFIKQYMY